MCFLLNVFMVFMINFFFPSHFTSLFRVPLTLQNQDGRSIHGWLLPSRPGESQRQSAYIWFVVTCTEIIPRNLSRKGRKPKSHHFHPCFCKLYAWEKSLASFLSESWRVHDRSETVTYCDINSGHLCRRCSGGEFHGEPRPKGHVPW